MGCVRFEPCIIHGQLKLMHAWRVHSACTHLQPNGCQWDSKHVSFWWVVRCAILPLPLAGGKWISSDFSLADTPSFVRAWAVVVAQLPLLGRNTQPFTRMTASQVIIWWAFPQLLYIHYCTVCHIPQHNWQCVQQLHRQTYLTATRSLKHLQMVSYYGK